MEPKHYIYIYIYRLHDASGAVHERVKQKILSNKNIPVRIRETLAQTVGKVAGDVVTAQQVSQKIGMKLCEEIPRKMLQEGITVVVEQVFHEGVLTVLQLQVTHVDAVVLVQHGRAKNKTTTETETETSTFASWLQWFLCMIGAGNRDSLEKDYLPTYVTSKLTESLKPVMESKLLEKNLKAVADIMSEKRQARFFFHLLKELREAKEAEKQEKRAKAGQKLLNHLGKRNQGDIPVQDESTTHNNDAAADSKILEHSASSNSSPAAAVTTTTKGSFGTGKGTFVGKGPFGKKNS